MKKLLSLATMCFIAFQAVAQTPVTADSKEQTQVQEKNVELQTPQLERKTRTTLVDDRLIISPNPALEGVIFVTTRNLADIGGRFYITDAWGNLQIMRQIVNPVSNVMEVDVSFLASGAYYATLETDTYRVTRKFLVIQ